MSIFKKTQSPYWWYSFRLPGRPRIWRSTKTPDRKLALAIYHKARAEYLEGKIFKKPTQITVKELLDWMNTNHWRRPDYK